MLLIQHAMLYIFDDSPRAPLCPSAELELTDASVDYIRALKRRLETSDEKRRTRFAPESAAAALMTGEQTHFDRSNALMQTFYAAMQAAEMNTQGFDMLTFSYEEADTPYFAVFYLPYRTVSVHAVTGGGEDIENAIYKNRYVLPSASYKAVAGAIIDLHTMEVCVKDAPVQTVTGERMLLQSVLLALESAMSAAETVSAIEEIVTRVIEEAPENVSQPMGQGSAQETARRAMASSLQETGALDVNFIASELFASDEERISRVSAAMEEAQIEPVVNVESTRIKNAFEKIRLSTDNGVSITLPRAVADDADSFRMINNPDGSISIEIRNIQSVETKI